MHVVVDTIALMKIFSKLYDRVLGWSAHPHATRYLGVVSFTESSFFPIPPDVLLVPRLANIGLMEFTKARQAIAEGRHCVQHALPLLKRYV